MKEVDKQQHKTCSRDGCSRPIKARGMCHSHYEMWHKKLPALLGISNSNEAILAAMPGTLDEIAQECSLTYEGARKAVKKLSADGKAHIAKVLPPGTLSAGRYVNVFAAGPGDDATVSQQTRRRNRKRNRRAREASKARPKRDPMVRALFDVVQHSASLHNAT